MLAIQIAMTRSRLRMVASKVVVLRSGLRMFGIRS
jgi:hypothetical protein